MSTILFSISKLATLVLFPLPLVLLLLLFAGAKLKKWKEKFSVWAPVLILWLLSTSNISQKLIQSLEIYYPPLPLEQVPQADVILVLGGMVSTLSIHNEPVDLSNSAERLTETVRLYRAKKAPKILFSGGSGNLLYQTVPESEPAGRFLKQMGIPDSSLILESKSRNTVENKNFAVELLKKHGWSSVILVTSSFHMKRSVEIFQEKGITIIPFPTDFRTQKSVLTLDNFFPSTGCLENSTISIKEWIGILVHKIRTTISIQEWVEILIHKIRNS
ncbi:YdcF family protein [Leptospira borgpetersenii]|uniref:YdcF family protein n=1 Tax=Leptospira borgpetersenii TaxID=174 RepID=UPI0007742739|nr:YdcF family protein [Leptospira borgpetersenii]MBE8365099.1 YdcF family protein [Leptospira borgpetersenii serovar Balcanica]MBE8367964.1 YdcF family protein [Leptospira borgpetersenii serovar Balcanica]MBE8424268.1 YdcF family protein [Leptospira borgpetersenii serovar Balcanica]MBF3351369.1 YdcF family protein [Leptospira borgpetersenii serovar Balcanica]